MSISPRRWLIVGATLAVIGVGAVASVAATGQSNGHHHCVAGPLHAGDNPTYETHCFDSAAEQVAFLSDGQVQLPNGLDHVDSSTVNQINALAEGSGDASTSTEAEGTPAIHETGHHCVAGPLHRGQNELAEVPIHCFDTFSEAVAAATHGKVELPQNATRSDLTPEMFLGTTVIGIDYQDSNYQNDDLQWTTDHADGCFDGWGYGVDSMPSGWDNKVSSAWAYQGCNHWVHFQDQFHPSGGSQVTCTCATMGTMNDKTSSEEWSQ